MGYQLNDAVKKPEIAEDFDESDLNDESEGVRSPESDNDNADKLDTDWDERSLAKLLDFDDEASTQTDPVDEGEVGESIEVVGNSNPNVIAQSELFDDPHAGKTKPTLAGNPFAKFGTVGLGLGAVFVTAAFFLNTVMGGKPKVAPEMAKTTPPKPEVAVVEGTDPEAETGKLKAELALGKQAEAIKSVEAAKSPKVADTSENAESKPGPTQPPRAARAVESTPPRNYPPTVQRVSYVPPTRTSSAVPRSLGVRSTQEVAPMVSPAPRQSEVRRANVQPKPNGENKSATPPPDPMEQWMAMSRLGSYGGGESATSAPTATGDEVAVASPVTPVVTPQEVAVAPQAVPVAFASAGGAENASQVTASGDPAPDPALERSILTGVPVRQLRVGTAAAGVLETSMVWANSLNVQNKSAGSDNTTNGAENFVVRLTQAITDDEGYEVIPAGAFIVASVTGVRESGYAHIRATRLVVEGREYVLPEGAIAISGDGGSPLIASKWGDKGSEMASRDATAFVFGSLAKVGEVLNEPEEQSSSSSIGIGGSTSSTSIKRGRPNLLGAVLEGGFEPLTEQILARNKAAIAEIAEREDVWYVRAGTPVQVVVNQSFEL